MKFFPQNGQYMVFLPPGTMLLHSGHLIMVLSSFEKFAAILLLWQKDCRMDTHMSWSCPLT